MGRRITLPIQDVVEPNGFVTVFRSPVIQCPAERRILVFGFLKLHLDYGAIQKVTARVFDKKWYYGDFSSQGNRSIEVLAAGLVWFGEPRETRFHMQLFHRGNPVAINQTDSYLEWVVQ